MKMRQDMELQDAWKQLVDVLEQHQVTPLLAVEWLLEQLEIVTRDEEEKDLNRGTLEELFDRS